MMDVFCHGQETQDPDVDITITSMDVFCHGQYPDVDITTTSLWGF